MESGFEPEWEFPDVKNVIRGKASSLTRFEKLPDIGNIPQTKMTYFGHFDLSGNLPKKAIKKAIPGGLMPVERLRRKLDKTFEIDQANQRAYLDKMDDYLKDSYSITETAQINSSLGRLHEFDELTNKKFIPSETPYMSSEIAYKKGDRSIFGKATAIVRANPRNIIAYQWDFLSRKSRKATTLNKKVIEEPNGHNRLLYLEQVVPSPLSNRDLVLRYLWKKLDADYENYVFVIADAIHDDYPENKLVRARFPCTIVLTQLRDQETQVVSNMNRNMNF